MRKALLSLPWVRFVEVDFPKQTAVVTVEERRYDEALLVKTLQRAGFGAKVMKEKNKKEKG